MASWEDGYWSSKDGLRLHYRDYPAAAGVSRLPILCLPGLTRNARDFAAVADRLAGDRRIVAVELRGRGESERAKDPMSYVPATYLEDVSALIGEAGLDRFILFGTSLGGILSMLIVATMPGRVAGLLLNDIGPAIDPAGLVRIRGYVGRGGSYPTWLHAARSLADIHATAYPDYTLDDWLGMAKRLFRLTQAGRIVADYDSAIAEPFKVPGNESAGDLWPLVDALKPLPALLVRGGLSDILSAATADRMQAELPMLERIDLPRIGHAPTLFEPECEAAIDRLLARIDQAG
ncbi:MULTISPECIES: alpha/beta fold hydrolase [unclassified Sphingomonas]|uniref:alpha/beta fold hydrolase n=1 Tax=unclassified Sphingomonas TaxID=196159 RepID=UPI0006FCA7AC|nr:MULTISPECIES: alpha/beta hydrolase [unclassified Sphingomonas]KQX26084.1 alpha/beta hydrolase [Sphingomonas sp. Root1294]KQY69151.1 alpha/beta hydrolase [Sphingomonas sp. Root50]KRB89406.1 alpha/beta hydrolase [Sphingomonas sp. Root720]